MTWWAILLIFIGIILKFAMSPPSAVVGWFVGKFALHPKLGIDDVTVTFDGETIREEDKYKITNSFNDALFLERNHIFPGNEQFYLNPETDVVPYVIHVKRKRVVQNFFVYCSNEQVDVVKQWKNKVASYTLRSDYLQNLTRIHS